MGSTPEKEKSLYEAQERSFCPEDKVVELRPIEGSKLLLSGSEPIDVLHQFWRGESSSSAAEVDHKTSQGQPIPSLSMKKK